MKKKAAVLLAGTLSVSFALSGCASNDASNDYVTVKDYKEVEVEDVEEPDEVTKDDVNDYIDSVRQQYGTDEQITDRAVASGDTVNIDYVGKMDGEEFDGGSYQGYNLQIGSGAFIDGFEDSVIGHTAGETYDWEGKFPDDYGNEELNGKDVTFTITVNYIVGETILPDLDDEFVQQVSTESKTVKEYKKEVKKLLEDNGTTEYESSLQDEAWTAVVEAAEVKKYPDGEVEDLEDQIISQYEAAAESYDMELADFLDQNYGVTEDDFKDQVKDAAESSIKEKLVAEAIADKENLTPSKKELKKEYKKLAEEYGYEDVDALKEAADEDTLKTIVITNIVKEYLADNAIQVKE